MAGELDQQGVVLGALAFEGGQLAAGVEEQGLDLAQLEVGAAAHLGPPAHDAEGFLPGHQGLPGQHDALVEFAAQQVAVGELGDEAEFEGLAGFVGGEELVEGGLVEALDAAPEVDLVADQVGAGPVVAADLVAAGDRQVGRRAAAGAGGAELDGRAAGGFLDVVGGAGFGHPGNGHAQVAVVGQGAGDEGTQVGVGEQGVPAGGALGGSFRGEGVGLRELALGRGARAGARSQPRCDAGEKRCAETGGA